MSNGSESQTNRNVILAVSVISLLITSGCIFDGTRTSLTCSEFNSSAGNVTEDEIRDYQNLSSENQTLFKKAINGTRVDESYTPSLSENFVRYENSTYDCDTFNLGA